MAKSLSLLFLCLSSLSLVSGFFVNRLPAVPARGISRSGRSSARTVSMAAEKEYWEGEWVCADCGYVYEKKDFNDV
jgi:hypothetical protein